MYKRQGMNSPFAFEGLKVNQKKARTGVAGERFRKERAYFWTIWEKEKKWNKKKGLFEISTKEILLPQIYYGYNVITF